MQKCMARVASEKGPPWDQEVESKEGWQTEELWAVWRDFENPNTRLFQGPPGPSSSEARVFIWCRRNTTSAGWAVVGDVAEEVGTWGVLTVLERTWGGVWTESFLRSHPSIPERTSGLNVWFSTEKAWGQQLIWPPALQEKESMVFSQVLWLERSMKKADN